MRVVASERAVGFIGEHGGRLYVWVNRSRCCGGLRTLRTAFHAPATMEFRREGDDVGVGFDVYLPAGLACLPAELHVDLHRFPLRVAAYWDGCVWIV